MLAPVEGRLLRMVMVWGMVVACGRSGRFGSDTRRPDLDDLAAYEQELTKNRARLGRAGIVVARRDVTAKVATQPPSPSRAPAPRAALEPDEDAPAAEQEVAAPPDLAPESAAVADDARAGGRERKPEETRSEWEGRTISRDRARRDSRAGRRGPTGSCETICALAESTCALQDRICALARRHAGEARYDNACMRAEGQCEAASRACQGCARAKPSQGP